MKTLKPYVALFAVAIAGTLAGCSPAATKAASVTESIRSSLDTAGLKDVSLSQDRDKGVVTLSGHVTSVQDKVQAESIAKTYAGSQVVANEIAILLPGADSDSKKLNADLDKGIEGNLDAALIVENLRDTVKYAVKNHVVTLTGEVDSQAKRARAGQVAAAVLNVQQVVNELQVKNQKATSSN
jgi:hyperosmotically inducible periplasmic protein